jgi:hypothetical protein
VNIIDIGKEEKPFVAEPIDDPFPRELPVPEEAPSKVETTEEPLVPVGA